MRALFACAFILTGVAAPTAAWALSDSEFDEQKKPWAEIEAQLPPYPRDENLLRFEAGAARQTVYIDSRRVGRRDGIVYPCYQGRRGAPRSFEGTRGRAAEALRWGAAAE